MPNGAASSDAERSRILRCRTEPHPQMPNGAASEDAGSSKIGSTEYLGPNFAIRSESSLHGRS